MKSVCIICLFCLFLLVGCDRSSETAKVQDSGPLSVEEWNQLPVSIKYDPSTFDRLKKHDPKLKEEQAWDKFMREVIVPQRKKDIPGTPGENKRGY